MPNTLSRRNLLQAAGGITFLALLPSTSSAEQGMPAGTSFGDGTLPLFTALPYLQGGSRSSKLVEGQESLVIAWQTNDVPAKYVLTYGEAGTESAAEILSHAAPGLKGTLNGRTNFAAQLTGLKLRTRYRYRLLLNGELFLEGYFTTRKPRGAATRFVSFGDNSFGDISDRAIAYEAYRAKPDFVMNTGDLVYDSGLNNEYARYFFPVYNADQAGRRLGSPLLRSVPLYSVIANHDVGIPSTSFLEAPDRLGYYTNLYLPENGPAPTHPTAISGPQERLDVFKSAAGTRYPTQANYSYDYGDVHFLCLDSNVYVDPTDSALQSWIEEDLSSTDAAWKIVVYHHPAFNVGHEHYANQHMRVLSPIFEKHGCHLVLSGHEHVYQRTRPLKFVPTELAGAKMVNSGDRFTPGVFTVDRAFDGNVTTKPDGIVYITTGAGGKHLYDPDQNGAPGTWLHPEDSNADYNAVMVTDRHSLTVIDVDGARLTLRQVDEWGKQIDKIVITQ